MATGQHSFTNLWKTVSSRWGHRLHAMCSYMAMFPPNLPHYFIQRCTKPGDLVLDPFCGRGTTPLEACLNGRVGIGNDLNKLAFTLTHAKTGVPEPATLAKRFSELISEYQGPPKARSLLDDYRRLSGSVVEEQQRYAALSNTSLSATGWNNLHAILRDLRGIFATLPHMPYYANDEYDLTGADPDNGYTETHHHPIWLFIHPSTLHQLVYLKERLSHDPCDAFIRAVVLGILHGRGRFYLSMPMPNTFSVTPRYALSYAYRHNLVLPDRNVFDCLSAKFQLLGLAGSRIRREGTKPVALDAYVPGVALQEDIRDLPDAIAPILTRYGRRPRLLVTSPPYLGVIKYGLYNWIRFWFLNDGPEDSPNADLPLDDGHKSPEAYLSFMREAMAACHEIMDDHSLSAWVIGDVTARGVPLVNLAQSVWEQSAQPEGWNLLGVIDDEIMENRKVTKIWGESRGKATRVDRVLLLYKKSWPDRHVEVTW